MTERELLIEKIKEAYLIPCDGLCETASNNSDWEMASIANLNRIADFILADRRRIVQPLIEYQNNILKYSGLIGWVAIDRKQREAIEETLNLSGVAEERK